MYVPFRFVIPLNLDFSVSRNERQLTTKLRFLAQGVSRFITKLCVKPILECVLFSRLGIIFLFCTCLYINKLSLGEHACRAFFCPQICMGFFPSSWTFHYFVIRTPHSLPHGRHNLMISRRTLSESNILTTIKGFGMSVLPTRASRNLGLLQGLWKVGDLGTVGITI